MTESSVFSLLLTDLDWQVFSFWLLPANRPEKLKACTTKCGENCPLSVFLGSIYV